MTFLVTNLIQIIHKTIHEHEPVVEIMSTTQHIGGSQTGDSTHLSVMSGIQDNMQQDDIEHMQPVFELTHNAT